MEYKDLLVVISNLKERLAVLEKENLSLKKENSILKERLAYYNTPKTSLNSSLPPSKDENRPNQSLRKGSVNKPGGQLGHKGKTLEMTATPDHIVELHPDYCCGCGASLTEIESVKDLVRQVVDIPPIQAFYTEYRSYSKQCSCGCTTKGRFPQNVKTPISYGPNTEALVGYFHARQYLPFGRMEETFNDVFNISISEGGIHCLLERFAAKTTPVYQLIKQRVSNSPVIGTDETGAKVNGKKHWIWTWQTDSATYIAHSDTRGGDTVKKEFPEGFTKSTLVSDGWRPQLTTPALHHQACLPHLLRRLNYLNEKYVDQQWGREFQQLLYDTISIKKENEFGNEQYNKLTMHSVLKLEYLLNNPPDKEFKELYTFYKRMRREQQNLLVFLYIREVPPDNNASERAIRNIKVKQKISGQFKTITAAQNFAKIRSVIDTTIKNRMNVLKALIEIAKFEYQFVN
ncbi:hypothetical protein AB832_04330 [Flavobacteriaceae bacterium (ex Bugula neritina AB1)]|nr:hypothetical protein AB832_04330 [Flavobacteriaceae bacterium (ex Bugula neritina AB1)]